MKTVSVTEFKAHALQLISSVSQTQEPLVVTKRGRPVVQVVPYRTDEQKSVSGQLAHMLAFEEDIVSPLGADMWESAR